MSLLRSINQKAISFLANLGYLWIEKNILRAIEISLVLAIIQAGLIIFVFSNLPGKVPLYYSLPWGEDQLTSSQNLFLLPILSLLVLVANTTLAVFFIKQEKFLSICLSWAGTIFSLFSLITLVKIITLIT